MPPRAEFMYGECAMYGPQGRYVSECSGESSDLLIRIAVVTTILLIWYLIHRRDRREAEKWRSRMR